METANLYSVGQKIRFYSLARDLFNAGLSHPQVIDKLLEAGCDSENAKIIADKALPEKWDELFHVAKKAIAEGKIYAEVIDLLEKYEDDKEIVKFLVDTWYEVKTFEVENIIESPTNILEGSKWAIIAVIGTLVAFLLDLSVVSKIIWIVVLVGATIQYVWGLVQRRLAKQAKKIMEDESGK